MNISNEEFVKAVAMVASSALQSGKYETIQDIGDAVSRSISALEDIDINKTPQTSEKAADILSEVDKKARFLCVNIAMEMGYQLDRDKGQWCMIYEAMRPYLLQGIDAAQVTWNNHSENEQPLLLHAV